jgi:hypothetical protein
MEGDQMADNPRKPDPGGYYGCVTAVTPIGLGFGACVDQYGRIYPQLVAGTPGMSGSFGNTSNLGEHLTGTTLSVNGGGARAGVHFGENPTSIGGGVTIGTPGVSATYGLPPFTLGDVMSRIGKLPSLLYPNDPQHYDPVYPLP